MAKVLTKIRLEECQILIIAPNLPQAIWYKGLKDLYIDFSIRLPGI